MEKTLGDVGLKAELVDVTTIVVREGWNSRRSIPFYDVEPKKGRAAPKLTEKDEAEWRSLIESMQARVKEGKSPNHTPILLRLNKAGEPVLKAGYRRLAAARKVFGEKGGAVLAIVEEFEKDSDLADRIDNLTENVQRADLQPWEIAESIADLVKVGKMKPADAARKVGLTPSYVGNLLRLKQKLSPDLWDGYKASGGAMLQKHLLAVCTMPQAKQVDAYNELVRNEKGGRPAGQTSKPAKPTKKGGSSGGGEGGLNLRNDEEAVSFSKLVTRAKSYKGRIDDHFLEGVAYGLRVANGDFTFDLDAIEKGGMHPVAERDEEEDV